jgi:hypothetical protein
VSANRLNEIPKMFVDVVPTDNHPSDIGQMAMQWWPRSPTRSRHSGVRLREDPDVIGVKQGWVNRQCK